MLMLALLAPTTRAGIRVSASGHRAGTRSSDLVSALPRPPRACLTAKHVDVAEYARRRRVADADRLPGLAFAAIRRAEHAHRVSVADALQAAPEVRTDAAVIRVLDDV